MTDNRRRGSTLDSFLGQERIPFEFTFITSGVQPSETGFEDRFFEAGCDDATIAVRNGAIFLHFSREAPSYAQAVASAQEDAQRAGAVIERVEPGHVS